MYHQYQDQNWSANLPIVILIILSPSDGVTNSNKSNFFTTKHSLHISSHQAPDCLSPPPPPLACLHAPDASCCLACKPCATPRQPPSQPLSCSTSSPTLTWICALLGCGKSTAWTSHRAGACARVVQVNGPPLVWRRGPGAQGQGPHAQFGVTTMGRPAGAAAGDCRRGVCAGRGHRPSGGPQLAVGGRPG